MHSIPLRRLGRTDLLQLALLLTVWLCALAAWPVAAQEPAQVAAVPVAAAGSTPLWLQVLQVLVPLLLTALALFKPLNALSAKWKAEAGDASHSQLARVGFTVGSVLSAGLEHYLEETQQDAVDLLDPTKRTKAIAAVISRAKAEAPGLLASAVGSMGSATLGGIVSTAIDNAVIKASPSPAAAVVPQAPPA